MSELIELKNDKLNQNRYMDYKMITIVAILMKYCSTTLSSCFPGVGGVYVVTIDIYTSGLPARL